ncbi:MAG: anhydro-N-acetylmuramic acid kinase, partial [Anaerolineae bacterium]|nr:anhydro-N-acetylmuramic acid kinase [Anaerolineae bacterium]
KTTGRELFSPVLAAQYVQQGREKGLSGADIIATLTALTAKSIAHAYKTYAPGTIHEVIVGGGGARNPVLMQLLAQFLPDCTVKTHDAIGLNSDYKEALVFAVLGWLTWHNRPGTSPQQTGARHASVLGAITPGNNYLPLLQTLMTELGRC